MFKKVLLSLGFVAAVAFAQGAAPVETAPVAEAAAPAVDSAAAPAAESASSVETELKQEIAIRDSVMAVQGESCDAEKDSLRKALEVEQAKSANWEKSYETMKNDNAVCAQALGVSLGVNEKKKEEVADAKSIGSSMATTSFLGGAAIGILIFWLITRN